MKKRYLWIAAAGAILIGIAALCPYELIIVSGGSMAPAYHSGQLLLGVKAWAMKDRPFERGEVVLCRKGRNKILKRIYALPGDEVVMFRLDEGFNLLVQSGEYLRYYRLVEELGGARIDRFEVPEGHLFVLGDAPEVSLDSRDFGPLPESAVIARIKKRSEKQ